MTDYLDYARRGRTAGWRYVGAAMLAVVILLALSTIVGVVLGFAGWAPPNLGRRLLTPSEPVAFFTASAAIFGLVLASFWAAVRLLQAKRFGDVAGAWSWRQFALGAALWAGLLVASSLGAVLFDPKAFAVTAGAQTPVLALVALAALAAQTFTEEWIFRGWLTQGLLLATRRPWIAAVLSGLIFGAIHIPNGAPQAVGATIFGILTARIAIATGGIALTWGLHLINNLFGAVVVVSSADVFKGSPGLFTQTSPGSMWWDLAATSAALAAVTVMAIRRRRPGRLERPSNLSGPANEGGNALPRPGRDGCRTG